MPIYDDALPEDREESAIYRAICELTGGTELIEDEKMDRLIMTIRDQIRPIVRAWQPQEAEEGDEQRTFVSLVDEFVFTCACELSDRTGAATAWDEDLIARLRPIFIRVLEGAGFEINT